MMKIKNTILLLVMMVLAPKAWALEMDGEGYFIIRTASDWNELADGINNGTITGAANARLYANIDGITKKIGYAWWDGQYIRGNSYYSGIFDGNGKTITVNLNGDDATVASDQSNGTHVAPFSHIKDATIKNICVKGTVRGKKHCSGLVSAAEGTNIITNAQISVDITATDEYCGGILGQGADSNTTISDCLFNGSISIIGGCNAVSGIWGWSGVGRSHTANIQNCLENGTYSNITNNFNSIAIKNSDLNITTTNCFYTRANTTGNNYGTLATGTTLTDGTVTAALQNGREEVVWIQDPVTNKPTLKQFRNRINISKEGNGSISCNINATSNTSEEAVTLTVTPDVGYFLHEDDLVADVYVDGGNANARTRANMITELPITNNHDGTFTFTLPNKTYDYTVEVSAVFRAVNIDLSDDSFVYTGAPQTPVETVTFNTVTELTKDTHYTVSYTEDVTNIGTKTVTVTAIGTSGYWGTATKDYTITAKALEEDMITVGACTYTGNALTPDLTVQYNGMDIPFTPSWANNINAGTGQVTIVSTSDNYSGSIDKDFTIDPKSIGDGTATPAENITLTGIDESYVYTGSVIQPTVTLAYSQLPGDDKTVAASGNYTVSYTDEGHDNVTVNKGGIVTVTGTGNYTGSIVKTFAITPKPFDTSNYTISTIPNQTYNGTYLTPVVTLHDNNRDVNLTQGTDFSVSQHKDAGTHTVTITALGNYQATLTADFIINPKTVMLDWPNTVFDFDGTDQLPEAVVTNLEDGDVCSVTVAGGASAVGIHTAMATALDNPNYQLPTAGSDKSSDYEILKKLSFDANKVWMTFYDAAEGLVFSDNEERAKIETYIVTAVGADGVTLMSTNGKIYKDTPMLLKRTGDDLDIRAHQATPVLSDVISTAFIGGLNSLAGYLDNDNYTVYILIGSEFLLADKEDTSMAFDPERCFLAVNNGSVSGARQLNLVIGDGTTGIISMEDGRRKMEKEADTWYSLDGRRIDGKPTKKGLYIRNGLKVVIR